MDDTMYYKLDIEMEGVGITVKQDGDNVLTVNIGNAMTREDVSFSITQAMVLLRLLKRVLDTTEAEWRPRA